MGENTTGTKVYIGPTTAAASVSAYAALSYVEIKDVDQLPNFGKKWNVTKYNPLSGGATRKRKGSYDSGDPELVCFLDNLDPGQLAAIAANDSKFPYAFKVVAADAADANDPDSVYYFHALVTSAEKGTGATDNIERRHFGMAIDSDVYESRTVATP